MFASDPVVNELRRQDAEVMAARLRAHGFLPTTIRHSLRSMVTILVIVGRILREDRTLLEEDSVGEKLQDEEFEILPVEDQAIRVAHDRLARGWTPHRDLSRSALWELMSDVPRWMRYSLRVARRLQTSEKLLDAIDETISLCDRARLDLQRHALGTVLEEMNLVQSLTCYVEVILIHEIVMSRLANRGIVVLSSLLGEKSVDTMADFERVFFER